MNVKVEVIVNEGGDWLLWWLRQRVPEVTWVPVIIIGVDKIKRQRP